MCVCLCAQSTSLIHFDYFPKISIFIENLYVLDDIKDTFHNPLLKTCQRKIEVLRKDVSKDIFCGAICFP